MRVTKLSAYYTGMRSDHHCPRRVVVGLLSEITDTRTHPILTCEAATAFARVAVAVDSASALPSLTPTGREVHTQVREREREREKLERGRKEKGKVSEFEVQLCEDV